MLLLEISSHCHGHVTLARNILGLQQLLIFHWSDHRRIVSLHFSLLQLKNNKGLQIQNYTLWFFFLLLCIETPLNALLGMESDPKSGINLRGYTCVEMLSYLTVRFLLFWVIVTQSLVVQELESESAIRDEHQHLLLIKQRLNARGVQKPYKSPCLVYLCLPTTPKEIDMCALVFWPSSVDMIYM